MKKVINYLLLIVCVFTVFTIKAHAMYKGSDDIEARSYIIGTHQFTRATTLTTRHIMLAAQTIEGTDEHESATLTDMKIYYKNASGAWVDAITGQSTTPPNLFKIEYIDLVYQYNPYTVRFYDGEDLIETQFVSEYTGIVWEPDEPTKPGYQFEYWTRADIEEEEEFNFNNPITSDLDLRAVWSPIEYTIAFIDENSELEPINCEYGQTYTLPTNTGSKAHYHFVGWAEEENGPKVYDDGATVSNLMSEAGTKTLYAIWAPDTYTIEYNYGTGSGSNPTSAGYDQVVFLADASGAEGYVFAGWSSTNAGTNAQIAQCSDPTDIPEESEWVAWDGNETNYKCFRHLKDSGSVSIKANWSEAHYYNVDQQEYYLTLNDALDAVENNETIKLYKDANEFGAPTPVLAATKTGIKLDLNGKKLDLADNTLTNNGELDIYSSDDGAILQGTSTNVESGIIVNNGTLTTSDTAAQSLTIRNEISSDVDTGNIIQNNGTITLKGGTTIKYTTYFATYGSRYLIYNHNTMTIDGALLENNPDQVDTIANIGIMNVGTGKINFIDGAIQTSGTGIINESTSNESVTITGGSITVTGHPSSSIGIANNSTGTVIITNGQVAAYNEAIRNNNNGTLILGTNNDEINQNLPLLTSNTNSSATPTYVVDNLGTVNFYDGKLISHMGTGHTINGTVNTPTGYKVKKTTKSGVETAILDNEYTVMLNPNGGTYNNKTTPSTLTMTYGTNDNNDIGVPTREGFDFIGWFTESSGGTLVYGANGHNVDAEGYWTEPYSMGTWENTTDDLVLYAQWAPSE